MLEKSLKLERILTWIRIDFGKMTIDSFLFMVKCWLLQVDFINGVMVEPFSFQRLWEKKLFSVQQYNSVLSSSLEHIFQEALRLKKGWEFMARIRYNLEYLFFKV